ncbi:hypothetical protein D3C86_2038890 [compost metagenome]
MVSELSTSRVMVSVEPTTLIKICIENALAEKTKKKTIKSNFFFIGFFKNDYLFLKLTYLFVRIQLKLFTGDKFIFS